MAFVHSKPAAISETEKQQLAQCEAVIEHGLQTFLEVGEALLEIRESVLYRAEYRTFSDYCQQRWQMSIRQSQRYMSAAKVLHNLQTFPPQGDPWVASILPTSERQVRALGTLEPEVQRQIWREAVLENAPITGQGIATKVHTYQTQQAAQNAGLAGEFSGENDSVEALNPVHFSSESVEWYTPPEIIDASLQVLGTIDLDPCSNSNRTPNVPARQHFTKTNNGLAQTWQGKVYLNPPYGREIKGWIAKLLEAYKQGMVTEALALTPSRTDTQWFFSLREFPRCFIKGRLTFSEVENTAPFPSVVFYLGKNADKFKAGFQNLGDIYVLL